MTKVELILWHGNEMSWVWGFVFFIFIAFGLGIKKQTFQKCFMLIYIHSH